MDKPVEQLIAEYLNGDERALELLVRMYFTRVYNFVMRLAGGSNDVEDIVQETFVKVWRSLKKFKAGGNFNALLFRIARNTAIDWLRKRKTPVFSDFENIEGVSLLTDTLADNKPLPDEIVERVLEANALDQLINGLPLAQREVLLLHYAEGLTFEEIGQIVKKPLNTVKSRHQRAVETLRGLLNAPK